jgi:hypothetical protein
MGRALVAGAIALAIIAALLLLYFYAQAPARGVLALGITDARSSDISHIYLTITDIELQAEGNASFTYQSGPLEFDLLSLVNVTKFLGNVSVPAGNYTMIRFTVSQAIATIAGKNVSLKVPSGQVKVPLHFSVKPGRTTIIVLDITADMTSISASGNLRPVVTVKFVREGL